VAERRAAAEGGRRGQAERQRKVRELLELVGLRKNTTSTRRSCPAGRSSASASPARWCTTRILLCDEATSALDPETTASILGLLRDINQRLGLTIVLITHEMAVIRDICPRGGARGRSGRAGRGVAGVRCARTRSPAPARALQSLPAACRPACGPAGSRDAAVVLRLQLVGEPELSRCSATRGRVRLLQGGVKPSASMPGPADPGRGGSPLDTHQLLERARRWATDVEVLGHVV
jgi:D-methionine transport system ATP-binding protein